MTEQTLTRPSQATAERRVPRSERIWLASDRNVQEALGQARAQMEAKGDPITGENLVRQARNLQFEKIAKMDPDEVTTDQLTADRLALALLEVPAATRAQRARDKNPHATGNARNAYTATLINFSDHLGGAAEYMPADMIENLPNFFYGRTQAVLGEQLGLSEDVFNRGEFNRIIDGIVPEVATLKALRDELPAGWSARHATLLENQNGADIIAADDEGHELGIDTKGPGSYAKEVDKYYSVGRNSDEEYRAAHQEGYFYRHDSTRRTQDLVTVVVDASRMGGLNTRTWSYDDPENVAAFFEDELRAQRTRQLRKVGNSAITK